MSPELLQVNDPSERQRAQGKPGAGCTRSLASEWKEDTSFSHYRFNRRDPAFPAQWF